MPLDKEAYVARVANASQIELVVINFEIVLDYLEESKNQIDDIKVLRVTINNALNGIRELKLSLNMEYEISSSLMTLYLHIDNKLYNYLFSKNLDSLQEAIDILNTLKDGFETIAKDDNSNKPVMDNSERIYSGLTYGKDMNLEEYVDLDVNRGFKI